MDDGRLLLDRFFLGRRREARRLVIGLGAARGLGAEEGAELEAGGDVEPEQLCVDGTHFELALLLLVREAKCCSFRLSCPQRSTETNAPAFEAITRWVEKSSDWDETLLIVTADHGHFMFLDDPRVLTGERLPFDSSDFIKRIESIRTEASEAVRIKEEGRKPVR